MQPPAVETKRNTVVGIPVAKPCSLLNLCCFNYQCFTSSMISEDKLVTISNTVGPERARLVMEEVLSICQI